MAKRFIIASVVAGLLVIWLAGTLSADEESRGFWVEEPKLDMGKVTAGTDVLGTFVFHNDSDADVKIIRAKPS